MELLRKRSRVWVVEVPSEIHTVSFFGRPKIIRLVFLWVFGWVSTEEVDEIERTGVGVLGFRGNGVLENTPLYK